MSGVLVSGPVLPRVVLGAALMRPSRHSASGWVAVVVVPSLAFARRLARRWARRLPAGCRGCVIRPAGARFAVSIPVQI